MKITKEGQIPGPPPDGLFAGKCDRCKTEVEGLLSEMRPNSLNADLASVLPCPGCGYAWIHCKRVTETQGKITETQGKTVEPTPVRRIDGVKVFVIFLCAGAVVLSVLISILAILGI